MPAIDSLETPPPPLTALSEDEQFFQTTVRRFAREQIRPYVREMDEAGVFRKDIIRQFFEMGLMGIEIPEEYGHKQRGDSVHRLRGVAIRARLPEVLHHLEVT